MTNFPMVAEVSVFMGILAVVWVLVSLVLILIVLVQKGKGGGLSSAFGGAGGGAGLLGTKTGDFLTWVTITLVALFFLLAIILGKFYRPIGTTYADDENTTTTTPAVPEGDGTETGTPDETTTPDGTPTEGTPTGDPVESGNTPVETEDPVTE